MSQTQSRGAMTLLGYRFGLVRGVLRVDLMVLYVAVFITRLGFGTIVIAFPRYVLADVFTTGLVLAIYPILEAVCAPPVGVYVDRRGRKRMLSIGLLSVTALTFAVGLSRDTFVIGVIHGVMGFSAAAVTVSTLTMITDYTRKSDRGAGMGVFDLANLSGYAGGILLASWLYSVFYATPGYVFFSTSVLLLAAALVAVVFLQEPHHETLSGQVSLNPLRALDWKIKALLPIWFALTTLVGIAFFVPKALSVEGFSVGHSGQLLFAGAAGMGVGATIFGRVSDKIGREKTALIGIVGMLVLLPSLGLALSPMSNPDYPDFGAYLYIVAPSALASSALVPSILALVGDTARASLRGSAMGLYSLMLSLGIAIGNVTGGYSAQLGGLTGILYAGEAIFISCVVASFLMLRLRKEVDPNSSTSSAGFRRFLTFRHWERFIKFNIVGLTGVGVNEGVILLLTSMGLYYLYSGLTAVEVSILSNFVLNDLWTFHDRRGGRMLVRLIKFNLLMLVGLIVNLAVLYALTEWAGVFYAVSNLFGIGAASLLRYLMSSRWAWLHPSVRIPSVSE